MLAPGCRSTEERELRQHRRRAGVVGDAARVVPERRGRHQPHGRGRPQRAGAYRTYTNTSYVSQHPWDHVEGAPFGTRGGMVVNHVFPVDAEYMFEVTFTGGDNTRMEDLDLSINGQRVALVRYETGRAGRPTVAARCRCGPSRFSSKPASTSWPPRSCASSTGRTRT